MEKIYLDSPEKINEALGGKSLSDEFYAFIEYLQVTHATKVRQMTVLPNGYICNENNNPDTYITTLDTLIYRGFTYTDVVVMSIGGDDIFAVILSKNIAFSFARFNFVEPNKTTYKEGIAVYEMPAVSVIDMDGEAQFIRAYVVTTSKAHINVFKDPALPAGLNGYRRRGSIIDKMTDDIAMFETNDVSYDWIDRISDYWDPMVVLHGEEHIANLLERVNQHYK